MWVNGRSAVICGLFAFSLVNAAHVHAQWAEAAWGVLVEEVLPQGDPTNPRSIVYPYDTVEMRVQNGTTRPIWFCIKKTNEELGSMATPEVIVVPWAEGWWKVESGREVHVYNCNARVFYWHAKDDRGNAWEGDVVYRMQDGVPVKMRRLDMGASYRKYRSYTIQLTEPRDVEVDRAAGVARPELPIQVVLQNRTSFPVKYRITPPDASGKTDFELGPSLARTHDRLTSKTGSEGRPYVAFDYDWDGQKYRYQMGLRGGSSTFILDTNGLSIVDSNSDAAKPREATVNIANNTNVPQKYEIIPADPSGKTVWDLAAGESHRHTRYVCQVARGTDKLIIAIKYQEHGGGFRFGEGLVSGSYRIDRNADGTLGLHPR